MNKNDVQWKGNFNAVITPFNENGQINNLDFQKNIELLIGEGINGIIVAGCTGEFWALSDDERVELYSLAVEAASGKVPVIAGTSHMLTDQVINLSQRAKETGVDGLMITPPYYILPNEVEIIEHYQQISDNVNLPILVYNIPKRVGVTTSPALLLKLTEINNIVAVKQSSSGFSDVVETVELCGEKIVVFAGHSVTRGFPCVAMGADGFVSSVEPQIMGKTAIELYEISKSGNTENARNLQQKLIKLDEAVHGLGTFPSALKAAMNVMGRPGGYPRKPILPLNEGEINKLESIMSKIDL